MIERREGCGYELAFDPKTLAQTVVGTDAPELVLAMADADSWAAELAAKHGLSPDEIDSEWSNIDDEMEVEGASFGSLRVLRYLGTPTDWRTSTTPIDPSCL